jgi:hypothetical protein
MAAPIVDSIVPASITLSPGEFADVVITAHDPDSGSGVGSIDITDQQGNTTVVGVALTLEDALVFTDLGSDIPTITSQVIDVTATTITVRYTAA